MALPASFTYKPNNFSLLAFFSHNQWILTDNRGKNNTHNSEPAYIVQYDWSHSLAI
jgi:hypothetical protein